MQISDAKHFQNSIKKFFDDWIPPPFLLHAEKWILVSWQSSRNMIVFRNSSCFWTNQNIGAGSRNILYILFSKLYKQMPINSKNILTLTGIIEIYIYIYTNIPYWKGLSKSSWYEAMRHTSAWNAISLMIGIFHLLKSRI